MTREDFNLESFWSHVNGLAGNGCWDWQGTRHLGYGNFKTRMRQGQRRAVGVHRIAFFLAHGWWPAVVCHRCDNPRCLNPAHLFAGTLAINTRDMWNKGRASAQRPDYQAPFGAAHGGAKLSDDDVRNIRKLLAEGLSGPKIAARFGVTHRTISNIKLRRQWAHVE